MQSEYRQAPRTEFQEHVKLERNHTGSEEEHLSEPSTMHSLSHLEDHSSPTHQTPKSSKPHELGQQIKQEVKSQAQNIKTMLTQVFGEKVNTVKDTDESTKQKVKQVNQDIKQLPKRGEQVIESEGKGASKGRDSKSLSSQTSELKNRLSQSIPQSKELDERVKDQINRLNADIKQLPQEGEQILETQGLAKGEENSSQLTQSSYRAQEGEDLWELAFHKIDEMKEKAHQKGQEFKQEAEKLHHKTEEIYHDYSQPYFSTRNQEADLLQELHKHHEHHLTTESPSFQPTEHSKLLAETVKQVLKDPSVPLTEKVEEAESHWKEEESHQDQIQKKIQSQNQNQNQPQGFEQWKQQREQKKGPKNESPIKEQSQPQAKEVEQSSRQALEKEAQEISKKFSEKLKDIKESLKPEEQQQESKEKHETEEKQLDQINQREPLLDKIMNRIHAVSDNINHTIEDFRSSIKIEENLVESSSEQGRTPIVDKVILGIRKLSHDLEVVKSKLRPEDEGHQSHESANARASHRQERQSVQFHEGRHSIKEIIIEGIHNISDKLYHSMEIAKDKFSSAKKTSQKQDQREFHQVTTGFSETVDEYIHETKWTPSVKSRNPFEALEDENDEVEEEDVNQLTFGGEGQVQSKSLPQRIKESFARGIEGVKSKFVSKGKENEGEQENKEKEHPLEESHPSKGRIRQGIEEISHKISQNIENVKGKFISRKEEPPKEIGESYNIVVINKVKEEIALPNENFKVSLPTSNENIKEQPSKLKKKKLRNLKSASKAYPNENVKRKIADNQISFEGFHDITTGFSKSVKMLQKELRGAPLVSSNPFEGLGGGKQGMTRQRKVSFQQESQYPKKKLARVSQSARKARNIEQSFEGFHGITSGFSESVVHFQKELRGDPLISANPFNSLITKNVNLVQPLDHSQVVGGHLEELTVGAIIENTVKVTPSSGQKLKNSAKKAKKAFGTDITNRIVEGSDKKKGIKGAIQKTREGVHASSKISGKLHEAKGKIKGVFHSEDKENVTQSV